MAVTACGRMEITSIPKFMCPDWLEETIDANCALH
jgi:hypothetical protein